MMTEFFEHVMLRAIGIGVLGLGLLAVVEPLLRRRFVKAAFRLGPKVIKDEYEVRGEARIKVGKVFETSDHMCKFVGTGKCLFYPKLHDLVLWRTPCGLHGTVEWAETRVRVVARLPLATLFLGVCFVVMPALMWPVTFGKKPVEFGLLFALFFAMSFFFIRLEKKRTRRTISQILAPTFW